MLASQSGGFFMENERRCNLERYRSCSGCPFFDYIEHQRKGQTEEGQRQITENLSVIFCPPGLKAQPSLIEVGK